MINRNRIYIGVLLISMSVLMLELGLTRIFSATMYYHFAFMAISLGLFGSGASGVFIYMIKAKLDRGRAGEWLCAASLLFALSSVVALVFILRYPLLLEGDRLKTFFRLAQIYLATALPFFFAGCVITIAVTKLASDISRLYFFDLFGASIGCVLLIPVLNLFGAINTILLVAACSASAGALFATAAAAGRVYVAGSRILAMGVAGLLLLNYTTGLIDVRVSKGQEEKQVLFSKWNSFSRITVLNSLMDDTLRLKIDSDAATLIFKDASNKEKNKQERDRIHEIAYHLKSNANVLIIGPGGGVDVMAARAAGMKSITAVEINPIIARDVMSSEPFMSYAGALYQQPDVKLVVDEGRSFIRSSNQRYDMIQATMVDTWAATAAGAFALTENNLYTVEAFKDYILHLTSDGVLSMTRWYFEPPDQSLRLLSLARAAMIELGIQNPARHVMLILGSGDNATLAPATFIFKKSEFTDDEVRTIEAAANTNNFKLLYTPLTRPANIFTKMMESQDPSQVWSTFETNVAPTYDNNPFFFNSVRATKFMSVLKGQDEWRKTNIGTFVLFSLFTITLSLVVLFIFGPLILIRRQDLKISRSTKACYLLYFACLGGGFIIVEIAMIQKFILFLGHPVYALTVVLFSLLLFSALGSFWSGRLIKEPVAGTLTKLLVLLCGVVFLYIFLLPPIFYGLVYLSHTVRIGIAVALIAPLALLMGMPMPLGMRMIAGTVPEIIPWSWGVNGATSVMGSVSALIIAILSGFNQALVIGAALYLLAAFFIARVQRGALAS